MTAEGLLSDPIRAGLLQLHSSRSVHLPSTGLQPEMGTEDWLVSTNTTEDVILPASSSVLLTRRVAEVSLV